MPGWEPERLQYLTGLFEAYKDVTEDQYVGTRPLFPARDYSYR